MADVMTIHVDRTARNTLRGFFDMLPLPARTDSDALAMFKSNAGTYDRDENPKSWEHLAGLPNGEAPWYTNAIVYLFEQIEKSDNRDELLYGSWTQLCGALNSFQCAHTWWGSIPSNEFPLEHRQQKVRAFLEDVSRAVTKLNETLELDLPSLAIQ